MRGELGDADEWMVGEERLAPGLGADEEVPPDGGVHCWEYGPGLDGASRTRLRGLQRLHMMLARLSTSSMVRMPRHWKMKIEVIEGVKQLNCSVCISYGDRQIRASRSRKRTLVVS